MVIVVAVLTLMTIAMIAVIVMLWRKVKSQQQTQSGVGETKEAVTQPGSSTINLVLGQAQAVAKEPEQQQQRQTARRAGRKRSGDTIPLEEFVSKSPQ